MGLLDRIRGPKSRGSPQPLEFGEGNLLKASIKSIFEIDEPRFRGVDLGVQQIVTRSVEDGGQHYPMVDYSLSGLSDRRNQEDNEFEEGGVVRLILRVEFTDNPQPGNLHWAYVLRQVEERKHDAKFLDSIPITHPKLEYGDEKFVASTGNPDPWNVGCKSMRDTDRSGAVEKDEIVEFDEQLYSFPLEENDEELLFIHMACETGVLTFYRGFAIEPALLSVDSTDYASIKFD